MLEAVLVFLSIGGALIAASVFIPKAVQLMAALALAFFGVALVLVLIA